MDRRRYHVPRDDRFLPLEPDLSAECAALPVLLASAEDGGERAHVLRAFAVGAETAAGPDARNRALGLGLAELARSLADWQAQASDGMFDPRMGELLDLASAVADLVGGPPPTLR